MYRDFKKMASLPVMDIISTSFRKKNLHGFVICFLNFLDARHAEHATRRYAG
jgi:hypothetical protein